MRSLRSWLKIEPHPTLVKMTDAEGDTHTVRIGESKSRWRDAENALQGAVKCIALNANAEILRTWTDDAAVVDQATAAAATAKTQGMSDLAELARIITEANDRAVERYHSAFELGYLQLVALAKSQGERLAYFERAWQRLFVEAESRAAQVDDSPEPSTNEQLIQALLPAALAALGGGTPPPPQSPPSPSNGKGSPQ